MGQLDRETLLQQTAQLGFVNVVEAFPRIQGGEAPVRFYEDRRKDPKVRGLVLTDELLALGQSLQASNLQEETAARWRLVETAWTTGVSSGLLLPVLGYDSSTEALTIGDVRRRRSVSGVREAISGYQDGRCAYCDEPMALRASGYVIVEHVLPWQLLSKGWHGPDVDSVWNLVLACHTCNSEKSGRAPVGSWMPWLERRNNDFIASNHPLRETLIVQTGKTVEQRRSTLKGAYEQATTLIPVLWSPSRTTVSPFLD